MKKLGGTLVVLGFLPMFCIDERNAGITLIVVVAIGALMMITGAVMCNAKTR
jgi:hypothetical protein